MSQQNDSGFLSAPVAAAVGRGVLVHLNTAGKWAITPLGTRPDGVMQHECFAANEIGTVKLFSASGSFVCKASGAFAVGSLVYGRASGLVDDISTTSAVLVGRAKEAATGANQLVEVIGLPS